MYLKCASITLYVILNSYLFQHILSYTPSHIHTHLGTCIFIRHANDLAEQTHLAELAAPPLLLGATVLWLL